MNRLHVLASIVVSAANLAAAATPAEAADPDLRIVLLGDSITKAVRPGVAPEQTFGARLESALKAQGRDVAVVNVGVGSERTDQALARIDAVLEQHRPDVVAVMYGANDSYVDPGKTTSRLSVDQYRLNLIALIDRIERAGAKAVLMTTPPWADDSHPNGIGESANGRLEPFVAAVRALARERRLLLVDHHAAWSAARKNGRALKTWTTDGLHPNPTGHQIIADQMLRDLEPLWSKPTRPTP